MQAFTMLPKNLTIMERFMSHIMNKFMFNSVKTAKKRSNKAGTSTRQRRHKHTSKKAQAHVKAGTSTRQRRHKHTSKKAQARVKKGTSTRQRRHRHTSKKA